MACGNACIDELGDFLAFAGDDGRAEWVGIFHDVFRLPANRHVVL
jgi:hypothetical protein